MDKPRILLVGAGPVGMVAANLLARSPVEVTLVERNLSTSNDAKAISIDAESVRVLQTAGLRPQISQVITPGTGVRFYGRKGVLFQATGAGPAKFGYAVKSQFSQPDLESALMQELLDSARVDVRMGTELVGLEEDAEGATVTLSGSTGNTEERFHYVLGCDGGRSTVRKLTGVSMRGESFDDVWLVVDVIADSHNERCSLHFGTPDRPHVIVPGRNGRCRYEFLLRPDEGQAGETPEFELIERLLSPFRSITPDHVERAVNYRFYALVADRWRVGRTFLLGDAAHMMPPFAGQGLNSGIRDASNLCWKLAAVATGGARSELLDTYEAERRPHATRMVRASVAQGKIVMSRSKAVAVCRDLVCRTALAVPGLRSYLKELKYLPQPTYLGFALRTAGATPALGTQLPQPRVALADVTETLLDNVLDPGFNLIGVNVTSEDWERVSRDAPSLRCQAIDVVLDDRRATSGSTVLQVSETDGQVEHLLGRFAGHFLLIRPDRYICASFIASSAAAVEAAFGAHFTEPLTTSRPTIQPASTR